MTNDIDYILMDQAGPTVGHWLRQSVDEIDATYGDGYAKKNPALVAAFIQAAAMDQLTGHLTTRIADRIGDLSDSTGDLACSISRLAGAVSEAGEDRCLSPSRPPES